MSSKPPLPDQPELLSALFHEARRFLDTVEPFLAKAQLARAEIRRASQDVTEDPARTAHIELLKANMRRDMAGFGPPPELLFAYMTEDELEALDESYEAHVRRERARETLPPELFSKLVRWRPEHAFPENLAIPIRRLYRDIGAKLATSLPPVPHPPRLFVRRDPPSIQFDGDIYPATDESAAFVDVLIKNIGNWVVAATFEEEKVLAGVRRDKIYNHKSFPKRIKELIDSQAGLGYKLTLPERA
jgi:hypothetical protein